MIGVLLVDDDPLTLELHEAYVARIDGFETVGSCTGARAALNALTAADNTVISLSRYIRP